MKLRMLMALPVAALLVAPAAAQTIDGTVDAAYGAPLSVQAIGTQFGDSTDPSPDFANGSELDAAFGLIGADTLYLNLTGNLQTNFNKLEIFFDVRPGGQNQLRGDNPDVDFDGLNRMGDDLGTQETEGLKFDMGFAADYWVTYTGGNDPVEHYLSASQILTDGGGLGGFVGGGVKADNNPIEAMGPAGLGMLTATSDQSNILGVASLGDPFASAPESVTTGFELAISLEELGWDGTSEIKASVFVNGGGHDFVSNQVLGPLPEGFGNLGDPRFVDFSGIDGAQYFVIPEPGTLALLGLTVVFLRRR